MYVFPITPHTTQRLHPAGKDAVFGHPGLSISSHVIYLQAIRLDIGGFWKRCPGGDV